MSYSGIINIGYVINEVGRFLFKINESQDQMYRDISDAESLSKAYKLPRSLQRRVTSEVINNKMADKFAFGEERLLEKMR
jgi:hypothetical protein